MFQSYCHLGVYKIFFPTIQRHVLIILSSRTLKGFLPYNSEACSNYTVISDTKRFSSLQFRIMFLSYCHLGPYKVFFSTIQSHVLIILSSRTLHGFLPYNSEACSNHTVISDSTKVFFPTIQRHVLIILSSRTLQGSLPYNSEACSNHPVISDTTRLSSLQFRVMF